MVIECFALHCFEPLLQDRYPVNCSWKQNACWVTFYLLSRSKCLGSARPNTLQCNSLVKPFDLYSTAVPKRGMSGVTTGQFNRCMACALKSDRQTDTWVSRLHEGRGGSSDLGVAALHQHEISDFLCESEMMLLYVDMTPCMQI